MTLETYIMSLFILLGLIPAYLFLAAMWGA